MEQQDSSRGEVVIILPGASISGQNSHGTPHRNPGQTTSLDAYYKNAVTVEEEKDPEGKRDSITIIEDPIQIEKTPSGKDE